MNKILKKFGSTCIVLFLFTGTSIVIADQNEYEIEEDEIEDYEIEDEGGADRNFSEIEGGSSLSKSNYFV